MKYRPILFSAPMVRAILAGKKTQTRRIIKFPRNWDGGTIYGNKPFGLKYEDNDGLVHRLAPKWQPGDRLWVRETWAEICYDGTGCGGVECLDHGYVYKADTPNQKYPGNWPNEFSPDEVPVRWRPSIFMPRIASRITLEVADVRIERLNDISEHDAEQEGFYLSENTFLDGIDTGDNNDCGDLNLAVEAFACLWDDINGEGSFDSNPWVWVISFSKISEV